MGNIMEYVGTKERGVKKPGIPGVLKRTRTVGYRNHPRIPGPYNTHKKGSTMVSSF
jgi:hypothetical protein